ncbi:MAG: hypothetical protein NTY23_00200 [Chloroflexi bacterium]|nr:hypothetical protein [Chloroflexota bacterium]
MGLDDTAHRGAIRHMSGPIALRADLLNRLMAFGQDRLWRPKTSSQHGADEGITPFETGTSPMGYGWPQ